MKTFPEVTFPSGGGDIKTFPASAALAPLPNPDWNVPGVPLPPHLYRFDLHQDYVDRGAVGGLDLTAQGSGNSFGAGGLILNGDGWANGPNHADVCDLGAAFSLLADITIPTLMLAGILSASPLYNDWDDGGWMLLVFADGHLEPRMLNPAANQNGFSTPSEVLANGVRARIVWTYVGGNVLIYVNGSPVITPTALPVPVPMTTRPFSVGALTYAGAYPIIATFRSVAVLKGTAWSAEDVAAIQANLD